MKMIKRILTLALILVVGWIIYVQFWGSADDKAVRKELFDSVKKTGKSLGDVAKNSAEKLSDVSFKEKLSNVGASIDKLREESKRLGKNYRDRLEQISAKKKELDEMLGKLQPASENGSQDKTVRDKIDALTKDLDSLVDDMEKEE